MYSKICVYFLYFPLKIGKSSNSRQRFRYGRLSMDADDQNQNLNNTKQHDDVSGSLLVNSTKCPCDESTRIDKNGNVCSNHNGVCDNSNDCNDNGIEKDEKTKSAEQKAVTRLQALAMSDDEDYGEYFGGSVHGRLNMYLEYITRVIKCLEIINDENVVYVQCLEAFEVISMDDRQVEECGSFEWRP